MPRSSDFQKEDLDSSPDFQLRLAADEPRPPTIIGEHWIDHLDRRDRLAKCKPNAFKYAEGWLPCTPELGLPNRSLAWPPP